MPVKIFFCYAHEDESLLNKLKSHLKPLQRQGLIDIWYDRDISAGTEWEQEISNHLNVAQIILLLVSPDFLDSDYCYGVEMRKALERHARKEVHVIPVILRPIYWEGTLGKLQALPTDAKPVIDRYWHSLDEAFFDVAKGIRKIIVELSTKSLVAAENNSLGHVKDFTEQAREALNFAQEEAIRLNHNYIGTEHLLLGLVHEDKYVAAKVLSNLGVELNKLRVSIEFILGNADRTIMREIGLTPRAKKVIELAVYESHILNHHYLGTEHLLLGILHEGEGIAYGVLDTLGITLEKARTETRRILN